MFHLIPRRLRRDAQNFWYQTSSLWYQTNAVSSSAITLRSQCMWSTSMSKIDVTKRHHKGVTILKILVACEESQRVCIAFRDKGHEAYSCDIEFCSGGKPEWHIWADVLPLLNGKCEFRTCDGMLHYIERWDMIIAFPPCTYLSRVGAANLKVNGKINEERYKQGQSAAEFFLKIWHADCDKIVIENPVPMKCFRLPEPSQKFQPFYCGEPVSKLTYFWIKGVGFLCPTKVVEPIYTFTTYPPFKNSHGKYKQKNRSKTFVGIAKAMALTWG